MGAGVPREAKRAANRRLLMEAELWFAKGLPIQCSRSEIDRTIGRLLAGVQGQAKPWKTAG